jgi:hypothetical protein
VLAGNVVALLAPCIFIPILTYGLGKDNYDWLTMKDIKKADDHDVADAAHIDLEMVPGGHQETTAEEEAEQAMFVRAAKIARWLTVFLTFALLVLWPASFPIVRHTYLSTLTPYRCRCMEVNMSSQSHSSVDGLLSVSSGCSALLFA